MGTDWLPQHVPLYGLALSALAAYWLGRVAAGARRGLRPALAWWALPGLGALLLAQRLEIPALFGVGAALLLLAEYGPRAYRRPPPQQSRPGAGWPLVALALGAGLLWPSGGARLSLWRELLGLGLGLLGLAGMLVAARWPRAAGRASLRPALSRPALTGSGGFEARWAQAVTPEWPELSLALTGQGASLTNVSARDLRLCGWSPADVNAWLPVRDRSGARVQTLPSGQSTFLPLSGEEGGVRVWYAPVPDAPQPGPPHLFRADWTPPRSTSGERTLH